VVCPAAEPHGDVEDPGAGELAVERGIPGAQKIARTGKNWGLDY
jgi:hypothetical protein